MYKQTVKNMKSELKELAAAQKGEKRLIRTSRDEDITCIPYSIDRRRAKITALHNTYNEFRNVDYRHNVREEYYAAYNKYYKNFLEKYVQPFERAYQDPED